MLPFVSVVSVLIFAMSPLKPSNLCFQLSDICLHCVDISPEDGNVCVDIGDIVVYILHRP